MCSKGLTNFVHDITFGHGEVSMLMGDPEMYLSYYDNKIPMAFTDDSGRTLPEGIYLNKTLDHTHREYSKLISLFHNTARKNGLNYGRNSVHYVTREQDCQHLYSLFFDFEDHDFLHFVVNNGVLIQDMIDHYMLTAKDIILEAKSVENRIVLPNAGDLNTSAEHIYYCEKNKESQNPDNIKYSLDKLDWNTLFQLSTQQLDALLIKTRYPIQLDIGHISLSRMEIKTLVQLLKGQHAAEIATTLQIKKSTVESYLANVKNKLGVRLKSELVHRVIHSHLLQQIQ